MLAPSNAEEPALSEAEGTCAVRPTRRPKIRQMQSAASKDAASWHKSGNEGNCKSTFASARYEKRKRRKEKERSPFRNRLHSAGESLHFATAQPPHSSHRTYGLPGNLRWQRDCLPPNGAMRIRASSRGSRKNLVPKSGQIVPNSSKWHFAIANCRCFYTLRLQGCTEVRLKP